MLRRLLFRASATAAMVLTTALTVAADVTEAKADGENAATQREDAGNAAKTDGGAKALSGMSILGNQEAPKALVIVPWKSSQLGDTLGIDKSLDDSRGPVDKDVFMRELAYYEIRSNSR